MTGQVFIDLDNLEAVEGREPEEWVALSPSARERAGVPIVYTRPMFAPLRLRALAAAMHSIIDDEDHEWTDSDAADIRAARLAIDHALGCALRVVTPAAPAIVCQAPPAAPAIVRQAPPAADGVWINGDKSKEVGR
jgi:hypothetical protein